MFNPNSLRRRVLPVAALILLVVPAATPAFAVSKEMVELQTQVQQLLDAVQRLQSTMDTRLGVLEHLAQQTADQANQVNATVTALQQKINAQNDAVTGKVDGVSGQVQSLNDSVDELKARIAKVDKSLQDLQSQLQAMQAQQQQQQGAPGANGPGENGSPNSPGQGPGMPSAQTPPGASAQQAPPLQETLQAGIRDYTAGRYQVAQGEFQDVVHFYPLDDAAGTAQFYLGEIAYQQKDYATAINDYNAVLEGFSGNAKASAAQLHKGFALIALNKREEGIHELRSLIQRHPQTPEARAARTRLTALGVKPA
ncbi:MAG TPA: tetratricopeptide repeat protein [Terracidiphilus sp.]|nr:tetratricopeptide repeat protein [Terracidiphilus sp.]